ncbi:MAG: IS66 family insertion sequence element accessory protein TnpB [Lachnospiraceae bacterium]|nr:IS66 family insertion sequence element accessory protein TnpB [Lachnospiraceae bacterium]
MFNDATGFNKIYICTGVTDLRKGIDGLAAIVKYRFELDPYDVNTIFLFCGRRNDRIKALIWEGDGFALVYKRLHSGAFDWPRSEQEAKLITPEQYQLLMQGFKVVARKPITVIDNPPKAM